MNIITLTQLPRQNRPLTVPDATPHFSSTRFWVFCELIFHFNLSMIRLVGYADTALYALSFFSFFFGRSSDITLELYETEITNQSTPLSLSLAKHLHSIGAKMYGAFWCSHCNEQKQVTLYCNIFSQKYLFYMKKLRMRNRMVQW